MENGRGHVLGAPHSRPDLNLDDELNNIEAADNIAENVVVPGLLGYLAVGRDNILCIVRSPHDPHLVATGGMDDSVYLIDVSEASNGFEVGLSVRVAFRNVHTDSVTALLFSADGKYLFSGGMDGTVNCFDVQSERLISCMEGSAAIEWMELHRKGNVLLLGTEDGNAWIYDFSKRIQKPKIFATFTGHSGPVTCGGYSVNMKRVITCSQDGTVRLYDPLSSECIARVQLPSVVTCCRIVKHLTQGGAQQCSSHSGRDSNKTTVVLAGCDNGSFHVLSMTDRTLMLVYSNTTHHESIEFIHVCENRYLLIGGTDGMISFLDGGVNFAVRFTHQAEAACTQAVVAESSNLGEPHLAYIGFGNGTWGAFNLLTGEHTLMVDCFPSDLCVQSEENRPVLALELLSREKIIVSGDGALSVWSGNKGLYVDDEAETDVADNNNMDDPESSGELGDHALGDLARM